MGQLELFGNWKGHDHLVLRNAYSDVSRQVEVVALSQHLKIACHEVGELLGVLTRDFKLAAVLKKVDLTGLLGRALTSKQTTNLVQGIDLEIENAIATALGNGDTQCLGRLLQLERRGCKCR